MKEWDKMDQKIKETNIQDLEEVLHLLSSSNIILSRVKQRIEITDIKVIKVAEIQSKITQAKGYISELLGELVE